jgi:adenylate cyclase class 2
VIEIEIKAWLDDLFAARCALEALGATRVGEALERDLYYGPENKAPREIDLARDPVFRLRNSGEKWLVTAKRREIEEGVERNDEVEFAVSDAAAFREFAQRLGFRPFAVKRKKSEKFALGRASIGLNEVDPLGNFIEVEILLEDGAPEEEQALAKAEVRGVLANIGIPEEKIEPRLYIDMIRRIGTGRTPG